MTKAGKASDIEEGGSRVVDVDGRQVAVFKIGGKIYAIDNICPHRGGPLNEGYLEGKMLTCPWHAWQFDVTTGACETVPASRQPTYKVTVDGDEISIENRA